MTQLLSLVMLFVAATAFDVNQGVALTPPMVLYLLFFVTAPGVVVIAVDPGDPTSCTDHPRDPKVPITNRAAIMLWVVYASRLVRRRVRARWSPGRIDAELRSRQRLDDDDLRGDGTRPRSSTR